MLRQETGRIPAVFHVPLRVCASYLTLHMLKSVVGLVNCALYACMLVGLCSSEMHPKQHAEGL